MTLCFVKGCQNSFITRLFIPLSSCTETSALMSPGHNFSCNSINIRDNLYRAKKPRHIALNPPIHTLCHIKEYLCRFSLKLDGTGSERNHTICKVYYQRIHCSADLSNMIESKAWWPWLCLEYHWTNARLGVSYCNITSTRYKRISKQVRNMLTQSQEKSLKSFIAKNSL